MTEKKITVLGFAAHPDDLEFMAGGTLANFVKAGHHVVMSTATNGDQGHMVIMPVELAKIRIEEAKCAAEVIGATFQCLEIHDEFLTTGIDHRMMVADLIRRVQPDIIITNPPEDYHPDHCAVYHLVFDASFVATLPHIGLESPRLQVVPQIFCVMPVGRMETKAEYYVDVSETIEIKLNALAKHASQVEWLRDHDNFDLVGMARMQSASLGFQCGVRYAECFTRVHRYPGVRAHPLLPF